jgi:protein O-mannosyl-transferase
LNEALAHQRDLTNMTNRLRTATLVVVLFAPLLAYLPSIRYQFVFDDPDQIVNSAAVHSWSSVPHFFTSDVWPHVSSDEVGNFYRPVFLLWLLVNCKIGGLNPVWWHSVSIAAHLLATFMVYLLALRMTRDELLAGGSALLFGLHPVHIEGVAWISGVTEPLLAIFFLSAFLCYLKSRKRIDGQNQRRVWWLVASLGCYVLAMLEKETAVILPVIIFSYTCIFGDDETSKDEDRSERVHQRLLKALTVALPYAALTILYLIIRLVALKGLGHSITPLTRKTIILTWPSILFFYAKSLVWPIGLSAFYDTPYVTSFSLRQFILPLLAILLIGIALYLWSRRSRLVAFFSLWMVLPLLPLLNISVFKEGEIAHDRYLYLPSIGFCVLVVFALRQIRFSATRIYGQPAIQLVLLLSLGGFFGVATSYQSTIWASDFSLASRGVAIAPNNIIAANNLGKELALRGDYPQAISLFLKVVNRRPRYWLGNFNLGYVYYRVGDFPQAELYLRKAIEIYPRDAAERRFLGCTLFEMGRPDEAEGALRQAIAIHDDAPNQHYVLGTILKERGDLDGALSEFKLELTFNPNHAQSRQAVAELEGQKASGGH